MNFRVKISIIGVSLGLLVALLPEKDNNPRAQGPASLLPLVWSHEKSFTVDQVARMLMNEDTSIQLVDLRSPVEFLKCNIPGAVNIPFDSLLSNNYSGYIQDPVKKIILYGNGDVQAAQAWLVMQRMGYLNSWVMKGGMNEWFRTVMLSEYSGNTITPAENAIFEARYKARIFFTQMNSLPDSAKLRFLAVKKANEKKLVGGCE